MKTSYSNSLNFQRLYFINHGFRYSGQKARRKTLLRYLSLIEKAENKALLFASLISALVLATFLLCGFTINKAGALVLPLFFLSLSLLSFKMRNKELKKSECQDLEKELESYFM